MLPRWYAVSWLLALLLMPVGAASAQAGAISQGYETSSSGVRQGMLLSLASTHSNQVEPATPGSAANLIGVAGEKSALELSSSGEQNVQVVVGGSTVALVSDANGTVQAGDKITVSPLTGIGMKAAGAGEIVGTAEAALTSVKTLTEHVKGRNGQQVIVHIGLLPITVNVVYYSAASSGGSVSAFVPPFLQDLADALTGRAVSPLRVLIGTVTLLLGFVAVMLMLYVGIRSGVISLGRNPLAADALRGGLIDVLLTAIGVLVVTGVIVTAVVAT